MLQAATTTDTFEQPADTLGLTPGYILDVAKRRWALFVVPFVLVLGAGLVVLKLLPAVYVSEGRILVESQLIPSDLVKPTVTTLAAERVQTIEQRIMTRDKLLGVANKFKLFSGAQANFTATEMLDFMRERAQIKAADLRMPVNRTATRQTIAFTVGFEHESPQTAQRVANDLITMILEEDVRTRTSYASETTRFLEREVRRLEAELVSIDAQLADAKTKQMRTPVDELQTRQLMMLRAELTQKSAVYSAAHPDVTALKRRIDALEKLITPAAEAVAGIDALERQKEAVQKNMENYGPKLAAARMGESLERGQQSERLEVIEQPTTPQTPIKPNRLKIFGMIVAAALASGIGLVLLLEMFDSTLRRTSDLAKFVDSSLIVAIPVINTIRERKRRKGKLVFASAVAVALIGAGIAGAFYIGDNPQILSQLRVALKL